MRCVKIIKYKEFTSNFITLLLYDILSSIFKKVLKYFKAIFIALSDFLSNPNPILEKLSIYYYN